MTDDSHGAGNPESGVLVSVPGYRVDDRAHMYRTVTKSNTDGRGVRREIIDAYLEHAAGGNESEAGKSGPRTLGMHREHVVR